MRSINVLFAVAKNTLREAIRNKAFMGLTIMSVLFIIFSIVLSQLSLKSQIQRVVLNFGFFSISFLSILIGIIIGIILVHKEISKKTIYTILSKPVYRREFIVGKYIGLLLLILIEIIILSISWLLVLKLKGVGINIEIFKGIYLIFLEVALVTSIAIFFSTFTTPVFSGIFTFGILAIGRLIYFIEALLMAKKGLFVQVPELRPIGKLITQIFPDLGVFNINQQVLFHIKTNVSYIINSTGYALAYIVLFITAAILIFSRREFL